MNSSQLKSQARRSYELARMKAASRLVLIVAPLVGISLLACGTWRLPLVLGLMLCILVVAFKWRGQAYGASVQPGLIAGVVAFSIPLSFHALGLCCRSNLETEICLFSGAIGGVLLGWQALKFQENRTKSLIFALMISGLTAALGCASLGFGAVIGLATTLVISGVMMVAMFNRESTIK